MSVASLRLLRGAAWRERIEGKGDRAGFGEPFGRMSASGSDDGAQESKNLRKGGEWIEGKGGRTFAPGADEDVVGADLVRIALDDGRHKGGGVLYIFHFPRHILKG